MYIKEIDACGRRVVTSQVVPIAASISDNPSTMRPVCFIFAFALAFAPAIITAEDQEGFLSPSHDNGVMVILGNYNGRTWHLSDVARGHNGGANACEQNGMKLAELRSLAEVEWVLANVEPIARNALMWTAGVNYDIRSGFYWGFNSASPIASDVPFHGYEHPLDGIALALSRARRSLVAKERSLEYPALCTF